MIIHVYHLAQGLAECAALKHEFSRKKFFAIYHEGIVTHYRASLSAVFSNSSFCQGLDKRLDAPWFVPLADLGLTLKFTRVYRVQGVQIPERWASSLESC